MQDAKKIEIAKPMAARTSNFRSIPDLLARGASSPPASSFPEETVAIKPKTTRLKASSHDSAARVVSPADDESESVPSRLSEKVSVTTMRADSESNVLYKPTAKFISRATASLLANLGNLDAVHQQPAANNQLPVQVLEQVKPNYNYHPTYSRQRISPSQFDTKQTYEPSNLVPQNVEPDMRTQQSIGSGDRPSYDGYNWRKYGQKQVKGSEYPRSYYKCTHPTCPVKKKVERQFDGQIAEIVYKGEHNHPKPRPPKRQSSGPQEQVFVAEEYGSETLNSLWSNCVLEMSVSTGSMDNHNEVSLCGILTYPGQMTFSHDPHAASSQVGRDGSRALSVDHEKLDCKRSTCHRKNDDRVSGVNGAAEGVAERHSVMHTSTDSEISGDGYHWRKYGQKVVKGNTYPRSYYRCTGPKCNVRKYVERASDDSGYFVTTYEGKHTHEMPARTMIFAACDPDAAAPHHPFIT
ncbi:hypothetical protein C4D60_Mb03t15060 [Musa balbisiana]|uniref:WRKY domain-containing protein n=1 Tax=Musa balbisiana TaxID=52838 RepID=A0A4S8JB51_MUSBA|nr:hypothetical protein C4D60_Mb03t15060 [Musa balbisiana]